MNHSPIVVILQTGHLFNVLAGLDRIGKRIGLGWVLLGLDHHPALVAGTIQNIKDRLKVHIAVAGHGKHTGTHGIQKAHVLRHHPVIVHIQAHILQVHMLDPMGVLLQYRYTVKYMPLDRA